MSLTPGTRIGPYEIVSTLGAGGMGEVYRARDTRLNREVALKSLPEAFAVDPDRRMRFEREAQALAALNHPNIAQIYAVEERAIVLELVEGEDLAQRIARGPLPIDDALGIACQIADALDAAHERGIVHRDLKPANVKLTRDGTVKVLDFGLAKALEPVTTADGPTSDDLLPTATSNGLTAMGVILGTVAYMAPEQARGRPVDKRADIWAFGVVLVEMLTGKSPFAAETTSDTLAAVLTRDPDWDSLPPTTPQTVRRLLARCLERDPRRRLRDIGDARSELEQVTPEAVDTAPSRRGWRGWLPWVAAAIAAAVAAWALATRSPIGSSSLSGHLSIELPDDAELVVNEVPLWSEGALAVSPDGRHIVYVAASGRGTRLLVRSMADLTPRALPGTEGARLPFFSPDSRWVGFFAQGKLKKSPLGGGTPVTLAEAPGGLGGSWSTEGEIVFAPTYSSGLFAVPEAGGTTRRVSSLDSSRGDGLHGWPQVLDRQGAVLFTVLAWSREATEIVLVDLDSGQRRVLMEDAAFARYVPAASGASAGQLLFVRGGALMAAPFDPARPEPAGTPVAVLDGVSHGQFDISAGGVLVYVPGSARLPDFSLVWVDRDGGWQPINDLPRGYEDLHLSPDGRQLAVTIEEHDVGLPAHVWLAGIERGTLNRVTFEGLSRDPVWSPDGRSIVFGSKREDETFGLYLQQLDGRSSAELVWSSPVPLWPDPQSWTPDGRTIVFSTTDDIWTLSLDDRVARPWLQTPATEWAGRLSPDGKWMAYNSNESGRDEVYVQPFPGPGVKYLVSTGGGLNPIWSRDGRELFYRLEDQVLAVDVETRNGFSAGTPVVLFTGPYRQSGRDFDVSPDGKRFVMMRNDDPRTTGTLRVVLDWWQTLDVRLDGSPR